MPRPVSVDGEGRDLAAIGDRRSATVPLSVNLMALESRLTRIWRSRFSSVRTYRGRARGALVAEGEALGLGLRAEHVDDLVEEILDVDLVAIDLQPAGLDLGDVEQPVDQAGEMLGAAADDAGSPTAARRGIVSSRSRIWA